MHKFVLAENPMATDSGGLWIVHLPDPKSIIEVVHEGKKMHSRYAKYFMNFRYHNPDGVIENIQLRRYHYMSTDFVTDEAAEILAGKILPQAWHWYKSYLQWEDKGIDTNEEAAKN